nr:o-succinylbenzoate synthase [Rhodococcus sp. HNM0569]
MPALADVLADAVVLQLPMRVRFRGITVREAMLVRGPAGWGEFAPFVEYPDDEAADWLLAGLEAAWAGVPAPVRERVPVNATVPAVPASDVPAVVARFAGARTAKVKVAERGQTLADDLARVDAVRALVPHVRVDANGGWSVDDAVTALRALTENGTLEYAEQPCATVAELAQVRARVPGVRVAADESIRRADDPLAVVRAGAADVAVVKVAPLGGARRLQRLAAELADYGVPVVVSSALDTAVGIGVGTSAAAALPELDFACGLGTGRLFVEDVADHGPDESGTLVTGTVVPDWARLRALAAPPDRVRWWTDRLRRAHAVLERRGVEIVV